MSLDISHILADWDFEPDEVMVRLVAGDDGREKIQMRLDLGVLQMEVDGRPDGKRPEGCDSWLDYYRAQQQAHDLALPDEAAYLLDGIACERLLREGMQFYHRYLSFWHLRRFELCARDTSRNLKLFKFVREHAANEADKRRFDQWRPYVTMMHTRAVATPLVELGDHQAAITAIEAGIRGIRGFLDEYGQQHRAAQCPELVHLEGWREQLQTRVPRLSAPMTEPPTEKPGDQDALELLRARLADAVAAEHFEEAARLRDELRRLTAP